MATSNVFGGRFIAVPEWSLQYINEHGTPRDLQVLTCIVSIINVYDKSVSVSISDLVRLCRASRETVKRSIKWLVDNNLLVVEVRKKPSPNVYTVQYNAPSIGSRTSLNRLMDEPINGSLMSLPTDVDRLMDEPIKNMESPACDQDSGSSRVTLLLERNIEENIKMSAGADGKVGDMIFGADPSENKVKEEPVKRKPRPEVNDLVSHFVYHPRSVMTSSYTMQEINILRRAIRLLLDGGLTRLAIRQMIDKFFSTDRMRSAESPVLMFSSKSVQKSLMDSVGVELSEDEMSPVLSFMVNDFCRTQELPWDSSMDDSIRKMVILSCLEACYRYPEVVARIIESSSEVSSRDVKEKLSALNSLVNWHLEQEDCNREDLLGMLSGTTLPKELLATTRSTLRPAADTIISAVYNYRRVGNGD